MLLIFILLHTLTFLKEPILAIQCFSCASEEYEALYKKGAFNFNYKPQDFFQPRFDYACDNSYETTNFVPVKDCPTNCVVVLEKQFFGGILNENRPYLYIRGCSSEVFQAGDIHSPEVQFLQKSKICLPLMVSQIWPHVESNEYITNKTIASGRQFFETEVENALNVQINNELIASYHYLALANVFAKDTVALPGAAKFFFKQSEEETGHGRKLMDYVNKRGGTVKLLPIKPLQQNITSLSDALLFAQNLEKSNNSSIIELHKIASTNNDSDLTNFLEEFYLREQIEEINMFTILYNRLQRFGSGVGEYFIDKELKELAEKN
uniref:Ferritin n=1 Tax=Parastrongyloides trichosuri TaxID=131310 RepID=A0A0N5A1Y8_PARTI